MIFGKNHVKQIIGNVNTARLDKSFYFMKVEWGLDEMSVNEISYGKMATSALFKPSQGWDCGIYGNGFFVANSNNCFYYYPLPLVLHSVIQTMQKTFVYPQAVQININDD